MTKQNFGFIKRVDKGWITTVKDLESCEDGFNNLNRHYSSITLYLWLFSFLNQKKA